MSGNDCDAKKGARPAELRGEGIGRIVGDIPRGLLWLSGAVTLVAAMVTGVVAAVLMGL